MDLLMLALLALVAVCTALYCYFKKHLSYWEVRGIPCVPGWPVVGNMAPVVFQWKHMTDTIRGLYNSYPEAKYIGMYDIFMDPLLLVRDPELIKSITIRNFDSFTDRQAFADPEIDPLLGGALMNITGENWRESKSFVTPTFTSSKMRNMHEYITHSVKNLMNYLVNLPDSERKMMETRDVFTMFNVDAIAKCVYGINIDTFKDPTNDFYVLGKESFIIDNLTTKLLFARRFPTIMKWFNMKFTPEHVIQFFKKITDTSVETRDNKGFKVPDMLQVMMDARDKESEHFKMDSLGMSIHGYTFFFGGFDTTPTQMCIITHELAANPHIQKRLQDEIDKIMQRSNGNPTYEDIQGMLYLDAVFNESLRRHMQGPILDRVCVKDFELPPTLPGGNPFTIKKGDVLWIPIAGIHMDPQYFSDPEKFDPDRYYEKKVTVNDPTNLGFGIGRRGCLGRKFAILEIKLAIIYVLSKFNLKPTPKTNIPLKYSKSSLVVTDEGGYYLELERRNKN